jgi:hypothetical protein
MQKEGFSSLNWDIQWETYQKLEAMLNFSDRDRDSPSEGSMMFSKNGDIIKVTDLPLS